MAPFAPFSGADLLRLWEAGQDQRPLERALALLRAAGPQTVAWSDAVPAAGAGGADRRHAPGPVDLGSLEAMDVATRDAGLIRLRAQLFGPVLTGVDACPQCGALAEFTLDTVPLAAAPALPDELHATEQGVDIRFRLPCTRDLAIALSAGEDAAGTLARRCILAAERAGDPLDVATLSDEILAAIERRMSEAAPAAEVQLRLACADCGGSWERLLDIERFLWEEIAAEARRLAGEVHVLARAYGWSEAEILGMSERRRQLYLEFV